MQHNNFRRLSVLAISTSVLALGSNALAQGNDEIIVTAQKKEQSLQDVPISIAAFDVKALENYRIDGVEDIGKITPGVYVTPNPADNNGVRINIRGIGTFDPQIGQDSRVAVYVDGVYLGKTQGLAFDSPDLARVEILKGPQGTLYGRNSVAGAVNLISQAPNADGFSGKLSAEIGNFDQRKFKGAVNIPLGDVAGLRLSGTHSSIDGWVKNAGPGTDFGGGESYSLKAAFGIDVSPKLRVDLAADHNRVHKEPLFYQSITDNGGGFLAPAITTFAGRQENVTTSFAPERGDLKTQGISLTTTYDFNDNHRLKLIAAARETDSSRFVALVPTANPIIINAITDGFNQAINPLPFAFGAVGTPIRADWADQFPGTPNTGLFVSPPGGAATLVGHKQHSFEATYTGQFAEGKIDYTGGAYYYNEETGTGNAQASLTDANSYLFVLAGFTPQLTPPAVQGFFDAFLPPGTPPLGPIPAAGALLGFLQSPLGPTAFGHLQTIVGGPGNPNPTTLYSMLGEARQSAGNTLAIDSEAFAIYGEMTWHVSDDFRLTGGLRYSDEHKDGRGQSVSPFFLDNVDLVGNTIMPNIGVVDFDVLNPSVIVEYDASENVLLYASYKQSFRSGGFNSAAVGNRVAGTTAGPDFVFGRENISAYEGGFKADLADNKFRLNAAGFFYDFKDQQTTVALNPLVATSRAIVNTDETLWGFEADALLSVSEALTLRASYTFVDGNAGDVTNPLTQAVEIRDEIQGTPKNSFVFGFDYEQPFGGNKSFFANGNYSHKDDVLSIPQNALRLTAQDIVSGRLGVNFETASGYNAFISVWGENLFDEEYTIDSLPFETFAYRTVVYGQPRTFGFTAGVDF